MDAAQQTEAAPPRKLSLMDLVEVYRDIVADADASDGEVTEEIGARFDAVDADITLKAEAIAYVVREQRAKAAASKALGKPYVDRGARLEKQADALEARLFTAMKATDRRRIEAPTVTWWIQKSPVSLKLIGKAPAEYCKPAEPDTSFIKAQLLEAEAAIKAAGDAATEEQRERLKRLQAFAQLEQNEHIRMK